MNNLELIQSFGKGEKKDHKAKSKNAIIYTRVSSKEQTENMSLGVQLKGCQVFAERNGFQVKGIFGGTYESAQTDERNEFKRMVNFAKSSKERISYIIVYSLERFSRTGENAIWLSRQLRGLGITILSVSQPIDTSNPSGVLQQNILFLFSQYDNDLRRQKSVDGMREKLLKGEWIGVAPKGYSYDHAAGETKAQKIVINGEGKFIRKAFELKAYDRLSNTQICELLNRMGFKITMQRLCEILRNPFYCGCISHNLLNGQVVKGKQEALISEEVFLLANNVIKSTKRNFQGYKHEKLNENAPLKRFVVCSECGTPFTAYIVKAKNLWYYKCNRIGCKCNRGAKELHNKFEEVLSYYTLDRIFIQPTVNFIVESYYKHYNESEDESKTIKSKLTELNQDFFTIKENRALGRISEDLYGEVARKYEDKKKALEDALSKSFINLSNPYKAITEAVEKAANLRDLWVSKEPLEKFHFQKFCFPKGILFDRKIDHYRTTEVNPAIKLIDSFTNDSGNKKADRPKRFLDLSASVASTGIEPASKV